jgi:ATP-binding cassette subfamily B (MDR/TAP) protein 1
MSSKENFDFSLSTTPHPADMPPLRLDGNVTDKASMVSLSTLLSFADTKDTILMGIGSFAAIGAGLVTPLQLVAFGQSLDAFNSSDPGTAIHTVVIHLLVLAGAHVLLSFVQVICWSYTAHRQVNCLYLAYAEAVLNESPPTFHTLSSTRAKQSVEHITKIQDAVTHSISNSLCVLAGIMGDILVALLHGWELTLVLMTIAAFLLAAGGWMYRLVQAASSSHIGSYAAAAVIVAEALEHIRTIQLLDATSTFLTAYTSLVQSAEQVHMARARAAGLGIGLLLFVTLLGYAVGMTYGAYKLKVGYTGGTILTIFFSVIKSIVGLGQAGPSLQTLLTARISAVKLFDVIHSSQKACHIWNYTTGQILSKSKHIGIHTVLFDRVYFRYTKHSASAADEVTACDNLNLRLRRGMSVALVGPSGSGKSTILALLERFHAPTSGHIFINGKDLQNLDLSWWRLQLAYVSQTPVLFQGSIADNILCGRLGSPEVEIERAAQEVQAHEFILRLAQGYQTIITNEHNLSSGEVQQIVMARALIRKPQLLLLDEPTNALDAENEHLVQQSLERMFRSRQWTTIIVTHRLRAIASVDNIAVILNGAIVEEGRHEDLMETKGGWYRSMVLQQGHDYADYVF